MGYNDAIQRPHAKIATTQWSQVLTARDGSGTEAHRGLESLCRKYWQPLYAYIRHQGSDPDGDWLAAGSMASHFYLWDLEAPPDGSFSRAIQP